MSLVAASITLQAVARSRRAQKATTHKRRRVSATRLAAWAKTRNELHKFTRVRDASVRIQTLGEGSSLWCLWINYDVIKRSARRWRTNLPICGGASMKRKEQRERAERRLSSDTLTDESTRMLDYLRTEVVALTRTCDALRRENDILRTHHERGQQARASAQQSVAAVAAHVRFLGDKNASIKNENRQLFKATAVLKEELAMRQAIYLNQVAQNAKLRRVMESMVDTADVSGL